MVMEYTQENEVAVCKYCHKSFRQAKTLAVHQCELKRRWQQEREVGVQLGLQSYLRFYEYTQGSAKLKTYEEFVGFPYYSAFVKFGQYLVQIRAINIPGFLDQLLKNNYKLDQWTKDIYYDDYLYECLRKEHPTTALERSLLEMQRWADDNNTQFSSFFVDCSPNKICDMIVNGRISPWVLYNCSTGISVLSDLREEQISKVFRWIAPEYWQRKFSDYVADTELIKSVLTAANL